MTYEISIVDKSTQNPVFTRELPNEEVAKEVARMIDEKTGVGKPWCGQYR